MAFEPKIVIIICLFGEQTVKCVVRVIQYVNKNLSLRVAFSRALTTARRTAC